MRLVLEISSGSRSLSAQALFHGNLDTQQQARGIIHPGWLRSSTLVMPMEGHGRFATLLYQPRHLPLLGVQHSVTGNGRVLLICGPHMGQPTSASRAHLQPLVDPSSDILKADWPHIFLNHLIQDLLAKGQVFDQSLETAVLSCSCCSSAAPIFAYFLERRFADAHRQADIGYLGRSSSSPRD
ncbi:hypothetical protein HDE76_000220 [Rhodanobacter sp. ANJX3]|nr:hypothetical protein [Rhodanobacter sp. ANJX3]NYE27111.1 hypothetical protein [Rhodanobacter sp. K2T2]